MLPRFTRTFLVGAALFSAHAFFEQGSTYHGQVPSECTGPQGLGLTAGPGFLAPDKPAGALIPKIINGRIYFSVNHRRGAPFRDHEGYFEFDVSTHPQ